MTPRLTFRARLTLAYTAIVAVAVIVLGSVAYFTVRVALDTSLDKRLDTFAKAVRTIVDVRNGQMERFDANDAWQFNSLLGGGVDGAVLYDNGAAKYRTAEPPAAIVRKAVRPGTSRGTLGIDGKRIAFTAMPIPDTGPRAGIAVVWEDRNVYEGALTTTLVALAGTGAVVVLAAIATGGLLARRMMRPITDLGAMVSEIEASDLTERLAWKGPDDELGALCTTFDRLLDRLESAFARERRFIADASHELRTPVSVMRAEVELALMHERTPEAYRAALVRLQRETQRLEAFAQSLILTTRAGTDSFEAVRVPLGDLAEQTVDRMRPLAQTHNVELGVSSGTVAVHGDPDLLERALVTIIENAVRFARRRVDVTVTNGGDEATLSVRDDGNGFSEAALHDATRRFWRDDAARSGAGTGLGLAIARSIAERHGGSLTLRNAPPPGGGVVEITLPVLHPAPP